MWKINLGNMEETNGPQGSLEPLLMEVLHVDLATEHDVIGFRNGEISLIFSGIFIN